MRPVAIWALRGIRDDQEQPPDSHGIALRDRRVRGAVHQAGDHQGGNREIVGEAAVGELDVLDAHRVAVGCEGLCDRIEDPRGFRSGANRGDFRGERLAAVGKRPHDDGREKHRHRHRRRNRVGHAIARQIAAENREEGRKEGERHPVIEVRCLNAYVGSRAAKDVRKRRAVKSLAIERIAEILAGVDAATEHSHQVRRVVQRQPHPALETGQQHLAAKPPETLAAVHAVIRCSQGASRNAVDQCDVVEEVAIGRLDALERGENAVRESRGAQPTARERQHDRVLAHEVRARAHVASCGRRQRLVRRRVEHGSRAAGETPHGSRDEHYLTEHGVVYSIAAQTGVTL